MSSSILIYSKETVKNCFSGTVMVPSGIELCSLSEQVTEKCPWNIVVLLKNKKSYSWLCCTRKDRLSNFVHWLGTSKVYDLSRWPWEMR